MADNDARNLHLKLTGTPILLRRMSLSDFFRNKY